MAKKTHSEKLQGSEGFESFYSSLFAERWKTLKDSLLEESVKAEWNANGTEKYFLDPASIFAAASLPLTTADTILDMCAAPGGKTLVLASLMESDTTLVSNERSFEREQRLLRVCKEHLPEDILLRVRVTCGDGAVLCRKQTECFSHILLDAPCSSERHVLSSEQYLKDWSPSRIKTLAMQQWALLSSAFRLLKLDGFLIYSTCALSKFENDDVVARLFKKFPNVKKVEIAEKDEIQKKITPFTSASLPDFEKTEYGYMILPDKQKSAGPIYFSLIQKTSEI